MNHFIFHNVGQGLFYSGHLDNNHFNFVYDCGTSSAQKCIENAVDNQLPFRDIDFVVISHLHKDHISGLKRLIDNYNVKKVYLPYLGKGNSTLINLLCIVAVLPDSNTESGSLENDWEQKYKYLTSLYNGERSEESKLKVEFIGSESEQIKMKRYCYYGIDFYSDDSESPYWKFIMFNKRFNNNILKKLNTRIINLCKITYSATIEDLIGKGEINKIIDIYDKVFGHNKINLTSTILIHYPIYNSNGYSLFLDCFPPCGYMHKDVESNKHPLSILTGDAEFDDNLLGKLRYELSDSNYYSSIFQVPHHGSKTNWDSLDGLKNIFNHHVISFGYRNRYHLPNQKVMTELKTMKNKPISIVTEFSRFDYSIY